MPHLRDRHTAAVAPATVRTISGGRGRAIVRGAVGARGDIVGTAVDRRVGRQAPAGDAVDIQPRRPGVGIGSGHGGAGGIRVRKPGDVQHGVIIGFKCCSVTV